mgnify:CR=1 FL=1
MQKRKQILETHANLSLDPSSPDFILKRVGNQTTTLAAEAGVAFVKPVGEFPNQSAYVRVSSLPDNRKTPNYLDETGAINTAYGDGTGFLPPVGSGSYGGAFGHALGIGGDSYPGETYLTSQTAGSNGNQNQQHPFAFYENITSGNNLGIDMTTAGNQPSDADLGGGYGTALSLLRNKDEYDFNLLFLPGVIDQQTEHNDIISNAIEVCEDRGDVFLVYDNALKTDTVATAKSNTEARNSSFAASHVVKMRDTPMGVTS